MIQTAQRLIHCLREIDTLARIGGDEFALLLPQTDPEQAVTLCRRVRAQYENEIRALKLDIAVTLDFGVAVQPQDGDQKSELLGIAHKRLYKLTLPGRVPPAVEAAEPVALGHKIAVLGAADGEPVLWVNVKSLLSSGPYAEVNMARWDQALISACARYPNMRVYNWAAQVRTKWYISDGIHFTSIGYKHRAKMIADALARAFPQGSQSSGCLVTS